MGVAISGMVVASDISEGDQLEIEQSTVSKSVTKTLLRQKLFSDGAYSFPLPIDGDSLAFNGSDWRPGAPSRWRVVPQEAYTESAVASSSTITFAGGGDVAGIQMGATDYFSVGDPVRVIISGISHYGICTAATDTLLTITGMILPTATVITSLSVGTRDMLRQVDLLYPGTGYQTSAGGGVGAGNLFNRGFHYRWRGATGYLVSASVAQSNVGTGNVVNFKMNGGTNVLTTGITVAAGTATANGAFTDSGVGNVIAVNAAITDAQTITAILTSASASASDYAMACLTFVVP